jgi:aminobenzoyl-glutamate utilization protein B
VQNTDEIWRLVDAKKGLFEQLSDQVWDTPELCYTEFRSCAEHTALLELQGFQVTKNVAGIPTAVVGEAGEDGPVIAILGEYDALPGLGQESGVGEAKPLPGDGHGHGCGHNLLGAASMLAATAVKDYLATRGIKGRMRYHGCPAEEGGAAKGFMARAGVFSDVDSGYLLASGSILRRQRSDLTRQHPHRLHLPRSRRACRRRAASRPQRARCGRADECWCELHA